MLDVSRHFFPVTDVKAYINKMSEYKVVISPTTYAYLDYTQGDHSVENPIYANLSLESSYEFEPIPDGVDPAPSSSSVARVVCGPRQYRIYHSPIT